MRVLFVDDDEGVSQSVETALCRKGHVVDTAGLGSDALTLIESSSYDFVVLDVGLPDMDGYHIVRRMKIDEIDTPIIMQTGLAGQDLIDDAQTLGVQGILAKPFSIHELLECMDSIVAASGGARQDSAREADPANPPRSVPSPERQSGPQPRLVPRTPAHPVPSPDPDPPPQTAAASGRALRQALMSDADPAADAGPKVRPAPARKAEQGTPPIAGPGPEPAAESAAQPSRPVAPEPRLAPAPAAQATSPAAPREVLAGDGDERRDSERTPTVEAALITEDGEIMACVILDLSQGGAQVKLAQPDLSCPKMFTLQPLDGTERRCEVRWRSGANIGLRFI